MTPPPSALGTLLVQRLDAVLGTTLAQHAHLMTSTRARAVSQSSQIARSRATTTLTDPRAVLEPPGQAGRDHQHPSAKGAVAGVRNDAKLRHERATLAVDSQRDSLMQAGHSGARSRFSHAARLILPLLAQHPERAPILIGRQPLWPTGAPMPLTAALGQTLSQTLTQALTQALSQTLAQTVASSGMFYESHLAALARHALTPAQLTAQPQAQLSQPAHVDASAYTLTPPAALLVRQQLDVLAYQLFCWQGLLWPGVTLDWQIQRRDARAPSAVIQTHWQTRLRLLLPGLGAIGAQLSLSDKTLTLHLSASACASALQARLAALRSRYTQLGFKVAGWWLDASPITPDPSPTVAYWPQPDDLPQRVRAYESLTDALMRSARAHGLYVHACPALVQLLAQIDLDAQIPAPLHQCVAELLVWLHGLAQHARHND